MQIQDKSIFIRLVAGLLTVGLLLGIGGCASLPFIEADITIRPFLR